MSCGHEEIHQIYGKTSERDGKAEWLSKSLCRECWAVEQARKREAESRSAAAANESDGLPALVGSPKQIAWAESIRAKKIAEGREKINYMHGVSVPADREAEKQEYISKSENFFARMRAEASAKSWIDNRLRSFGDELDVFMGEE